MSTTLQNITELDLIKTTGLVEICKYNRNMINGYWDLHRKDIIKILKFQLDHNVDITIPPLDIKHYKKIVIEGY